MPKPTVIHLQDLNAVVDLLESQRREIDRILGLWTEKRDDAVHRLVYGTDEA